MLEVVFIFLLMSIGLNVILLRIAIAATRIGGSYTGGYKPSIGGYQATTENPPEMVPPGPPLSRPPKDVD